MTPFALPQLPPPCWRYTILQQCNVANTRMLPNCCLQNYASFEIQDYDFRISARSFVPTWRRDFFNSQFIYRNVTHIDAFFEELNAPPKLEAPRPQGLIEPACNHPWSADPTRSLRHRLILAKPAATFVFDARQRLIYSSSKSGQRLLMRQRWRRRDGGEGDLDTRKLGNKQWRGRRLQPDWKKDEKAEMNNCRRGRMSAESLPSGRLTRI